MYTYTLFSLLVTCLQITANSPVNIYSSANKPQDQHVENQQTGVAKYLANNPVTAGLSAVSAITIGSMAVKKSLMAGEYDKEHAKTIRLQEEKGKLAFELNAIYQKINREKALIQVEFERNVFQHKQLAAQFERTRQLSRGSTLSSQQYATLMCELILSEFSSSSKLSRHSQGISIQGSYLETITSLD